MPADAPTILATSGGFRRGNRTDVAFAPLVLHAIELSGVSARRPRLCHVGAAMGAQRMEAVSEVAGKGAYVVRRTGEHAVEERIEPRLLPGAS